MNYLEKIKNCIKDACLSCKIEFNESDFTINDSVTYFHTPYALPKNHNSVFMFINENENVLGVYKANSNCNARFQYQHYGINRASGSLSKSLYNDPNSIQFHKDDVGNWLKLHTRRIDILFSDSFTDNFSSYLKRNLQEELNPVYKSKRN